MEGLARLVTESLARHGFETTFDHRRLQWSKWFRCEDSFSLLLVPSQPGLFALAEEVIAPGEISTPGGKRMLALFQISQAEDVGMALGRLFLPGKPERERLASGRCFARYAVIEDAAQRDSAHAALQKWIAASAGAASGAGAAESIFEPGSIAASQSKSGETSSAGAAYTGPARECWVEAERNRAPHGLQVLSQSALTAQSSNGEGQIGPPASLPTGF